jgi:hypothetical protein
VQANEQVHASARICMHFLKGNVTSTIVQLHVYQHNFALSKWNILLYKKLAQLIKINIFQMQ